MALVVDDCIQAAYFEEVIEFFERLNLRAEEFENDEDPAQEVQDQLSAVGILTDMDGDDLIVEGIDLQQFRDDPGFIDQVLELMDMIETLVDPSWDDHAVSA